MIKSDRDYSAYRFLIVDDKPFLRTLIHGMLSRCKAAEILHAADGNAAIELLRDAQGTIDCVLCDWNMEPIDGLKLLKLIRSGNILNTPRDLRFIMLTGYAEAEIVETAMALDTNGYVVKPVSLMKLVRAIDNVFSGPMTLKREEAYLAETTIELPNPEPIQEKRIPPWVLLSKMPAKKKKEISSRLELIQREGENPLGGKRNLVNEERLDITQIKPGRILAENIYTEHGTLLLAAGMVLSRTLLGRLRELSDLSSEEIRFAVGDHES